MAEHQVDYRGCRIIESVPGGPVLKGERLPVQGIVDNYDAGLSPAEVAETFDVPLAQVTAILEYREKHFEILLDHNGPAQMIGRLSRHAVSAAAAKGWDASTNGRLLNAADQIFDVFVTCDQNSVHQRNLAGLRISAVAVNTNL